MRRRHPLPRRRSRHSLHRRRSLADPPLLLPADLEASCLIPLSSPSSLQTPIARTALNQRQGQLRRGEEPREDYHAGQLEGRPQRHKRELQLQTRSSPRITGRCLQVLPAMIVRAAPR
ncbi:hypothetical protein PVAP13_9KG426833 [Panicum virgatum]|uniref:Uncharacterized protein n=1 Tax=Panicum virgatum TaxID=38727 RepID=A0A8T0NS20_PANVG|nr:hypothetical protein PVAP13_9KG426833 [Panicum virgatum]